MVGILMSDFVSLYGTNYTVETLPAFSTNLLLQQLLRKMILKTHQS